MKLSEVVSSKVDDICRINATQFKYFLCTFLEDCANPWIGRMKPGNSLVFEEDELQALCFLLRLILRYARK